MSIVDKNNCNTCHFSWKTLGCFLLLKKCASTHRPANETSSLKFKSKSKWLGSLWKLERDLAHFFDKFLMHWYKFMSISFAKKLLWDSSLHTTIDHRNYLPTHSFLTSCLMSMFSKLLHISSAIFFFKFASSLCSCIFLGDPNFWLPNSNLQYFQSCNLTQIYKQCFWPLQYLAVLITSLKIRRILK